MKEVSKERIEELKLIENLIISTESTKERCINGNAPKERIERVDNDLAKLESIKEKLQHFTPISSEEKTTEAVKTLLDAIKYAEQEENANYVITTQDIEMLEGSLPISSEGVSQQRERLLINTLKLIEKESSENYARVVAKNTLQEIQEGIKPISSDNPSEEEQVKDTMSLLKLIKELSDKAYTLGLYNNAEGLRSEFFSKETEVLAKVAIINSKLLEKSTLPKESVTDEDEKKCTICNSKKTYLRVTFFKGKIETPFYACREHVKEVEAHVKSLFGGETPNRNQN